MGGEGGDGNSNNHAKDNKGSHELAPGKIQLNGSSCFQAQFRSLAACNQEDDLTFNERTVKDVTDIARRKAVARLQQAVEEALRSAPGALVPAAAPPPASSSSAPALPTASDSAVRQEVRAAVRQLQRLRADGKNVGRDVAAAEILQHLDSLDVNVLCLKATKVAAELNSPCWRGSETSPQVRAHAAALVRRWRAMYRAEGGNPGAALDGAPSAAQARRCRNLCCDLEDCAYGYNQKVAGHSQIVESVIERLIRNPMSAIGLIAGDSSTKDFMARVANDLRLLKGVANSAGKRKELR